MHRPQGLEFRYHKTILPNETVGEILPKISQAVVFKVRDAKEGFWHVKLDKESSLSLHSGVHVENTIEHVCHLDSHKHPSSSNECSMKRALSIH